MRKIQILTLLLSLVFFSCTSAPKGNLLNPKDYKEKMAELKNAVLIDVRTPGEYSEGHLKGAKNINWNDPSFDGEVAKLDKKKPIFVYCRSGGRSGSATSALRNMGFTEVYDLQGGIMNWTRSGNEVVTKD